MTGFIYLLLFIGLGVAGYYLWWSFYVQDTVQVRSADKVIIISNVFNGNLKVLRKGNHFLGPGWKVLKTDLDLSRRPVTRTEGNNRELVTDNQGLELRVPYAYDFIFARQRDKITGALLPHVDSDNFDQVKEKEIEDYFLKTDDPQGHIQRVISQVLEAEFGLYKYDKVVAGESVDLRVRQLSPDRTSISMTTVTVRNKTEFLSELSKTCEIQINQHLNWIGFNVIDFKLVGVEPADPEIQQAIQRKARNERRSAAMKPLLDQGISPRAALAQDADYAKALEADAQLYRADADITIAKTKINIAEIIARAAEALPEKIFEAWYKPRP